MALRPESFERLKKFAQQGGDARWVNEIFEAMQEALDALGQGNTEYFNQITLDPNDPYLDYNAVAVTTSATSPDGSAIIFVVLITGDNPRSDIFPLAEIEVPGQYDPAFADTWEDARSRIVEVINDTLERRTQENDEM
jgi:hypothetical protein